MGQQRNAVQENSNKDSTSNDANNIIYSKASLTVANVFPSTSMKTTIDTVSIAYNAGATPAKILTTTTTTAVHSSANVTTRLQAIPAVYPPITILVNGPVTPPVDSIITAPGRVPMAESSMDIPPFYTSTSVSINAREYGKLLTIVAHVSVLLIIHVR